jgi:hypothetical protein
MKAKKGNAAPLVVKKLFSRDDKRTDQKEQRGQGKMTCTHFLTQIGPEVSQPKTPFRIN